jgi:hypothetical protein
MNDIDALLRDAGDRWRAAQPTPPRFDPGIFASTSRRSRWSSTMAAAVVVGIVAVSLLALQFERMPSVGGEPPLGGPTGKPSAAANSPSPRSASASPWVAPACELTLPDPILVPPAGYLQETPRTHGTEWFGTAELWTVLDRDGEVWPHPVDQDALTAKTVWWSVNWDPEAEPEPAITVRGRRLDAPGSFSFFPGTNATAPGFDTAMMVGIEVPEPGCWEITATYLDASLTYVALVTGD